MSVSVSVCLSLLSRFLSVFSYVRTIVRLTMLGIYNAHIDVDRCDCTRGCTDTVRQSELKDESGGGGGGGGNPLSHRVLEPASVLLLAFQSNGQPTEPFSLRSRL